MCQINKEEFPGEGRRAERREYSVNKRGGCLYSISGKNILDSGSIGAFCKSFCSLFFEIGFQEAKIRFCTRNAFLVLAFSVYL